MDLFWSHNILYHELLAATVLTNFVHLVWSAVSLSEFGIEQKMMKNLQSQTRFDLKMLTLLSLKAAGPEATQRFPGSSCGLVLNDLLLRWCLSPGWNVGCFNLSPGWNVGCFKILWVLWAHQTSLHALMHACVCACVCYTPSPQSKTKQPQ